ncbi:hypothetical protein RB195_001317 [Necator americanus]|uniref:JmjC domain-containing protein n=1 Tax=Necator americanus TaxID=51031 RepID=A0ABR1DDQ3_NECAM
MSECGADQQYQFHEFVPCGSSTPASELSGTTAASRSSHLLPYCLPSTTTTSLDRENAEFTVKQELKAEEISSTSPSADFTDHKTSVMKTEEEQTISSRSTGVLLPLSIDTKALYTSLPSYALFIFGFHFALFPVSENEHCTGSLNECAVCGPEKAIWVPNTSETGEPLIEPTSKHGQTIKIDPIDTFWIQCDGCAKWFHGSCVGVEEYEDVLIDKFHCVECALTKGSTQMKTVLLRHRFAFDDLSQANLPVEIGTESWIKEFVKIEAKIPPPNEQHVIICKNGFDFMDQFDRRSDWKKVYLIEQPRGLELRVPDKEENFSLRSIVEILGRSYKVDTIDVYRQVTQSMCIGTFYDKMVAPQRLRLYNILSLEFSQNESMRKMISPPILVPELSFVHKLWPDKNDLVNWDPELQQVVEVLEEHRRNKPEVALFCLCGMAGSYTDFHIDFGGSSVWYHIYEGQKIFYIVEPTDEFLDLFEEHQRSETKTETFFGDLLPQGALRRVVIDEGQTLMIPSGWIHAVYTPLDSLVFGGNFLHALNVPMQLKIYEMEQRLKKEVGTEDKYLFPHFELVNWYAARSLVLEHLREANDEGSRVEQYMFDAALALLPRLKEWMRRDKEDKANVTHSSFSDVLVKLQREINKQQRLRRSLSPARRSPKKSAKKRKSEEHELFVEAGTNTSSVSESASSSHRRSDLETCTVQSETHVTQPTSSTGAESCGDPQNEIPVDFRLKLTKRGKNYASSVVEKPDPMLEEVNMTQMFARRSHSGRQPRPSAWLAEAVGLDELEKTAKQLEEQGEQLPEREIVTYDVEMELACEEEERDLLREERAKKKGKVVVGSGDPLRGIAKKKPSTVKQRLAAKLKLK